jgi:stage V sporulation protein B
MTGILQGLGKVFVPVINLFIGAILKAVVNLILVSNPDININGAPIGTIVCYATAAILNLVAVIRYAGIKMDFFNTIIKPVFATALMALSVTVCKIVLPDGSRLTTLAAVAVGVCIYAVALILLGAFTPTDLEVMPAGHKLGKIINKVSPARRKK